jgi:hypothetical protein
MPSVLGPMRSDWLVVNEFFRDVMVDEPANTVFVNCTFERCSWPDESAKKCWHARDCRFVECNVIPVGGIGEDGRLIHRAWISLAGCDVLQENGFRFSTDRNGAVYDHQLRRWDFQN